MSSYWREVLLLTLGITKLVGANNCLDMESVVQRDKYMEHQVFRKFGSQSLYTCAAECLMSSACLSFGFENYTSTCLLNSKSSDTANVVDRTGFLFSDIQHWPKSLSGPCAQIECHNNASCEVTRLGLVRCAPEFQGCGPPPEIRDASITYDGHYKGAVATYSRYTCDPDYRACYNTVTSNCQSSGLWVTLTGLCGQYRWHNPGTDRHSIPCGPSSKFHLTLNGTPTKDARWAIVIRKQADLLCSLGFRLNYDGYSNVVVINTRIDNIWGSEISFDLPMAVGQTMEIQITLQDGVYRIMIDGASVHNLTERDPGAKPDQFNFWGDVDVSMMELMS